MNGQDEEKNLKKKTAFTEEQRRVIEARDRSLLVSAAAGSGKTAVLVERILSMVTDPVHPIDVDELLVVTFTNAAAAEMRERILNALTEAADEQPDNAHLQRQMSLIHNAQITTVDSFCLQVVTDHFHCISLEPGFRIADEGELLLFREDVCDAVLEDFYRERDPGFLRFIGGYSDAKSDRKIRDMILKLYDYAQCYPWPKEWLDQCAGQYDADSAGELENKDWSSGYLDYIHARAEEMAAQYRRIIALSKDEDGPNVYVSTLEKELTQLEKLASGGGMSEPEELASGGGISELREALAEITFDRLPSVRGTDINKEKKEEIQALRNRIKAQIVSLKKEFAADTEAQLELLAGAGEMVRVLVDLTKAFSDRFAEEKEKKNILDFSDVEHFALRILVDPETKEPTEIAGEYRQSFREVMIDEYQDSNYLQEAILIAVSGIPEGRQNMFMVGDVKQSIYRFRQACPALFLEKYETFPMTENPTQRIDLHKNFRSRPEVISTVNDLFGRIMGRDLGNIEYDADAALYQGRKIGNDGETEPGQERETDEDGEADFSTECILAECEAGEDKKLTEAGVIARRIRRMVEEEEIPEIQYRDIVILLRSMSGWTEPFVTAFEQEGVPLTVASRTGYFSAQEVQVVLAMLRVIDNPRQDIPLATVMKSPIGGFTDEDMAVIKASYPDLPFFECVKKVYEEGTCDDPEICEKLRAFLEMTGDFRARMPYTPIHLLIRQIYDETGYRDFATAMPAGEQRRANLDMLLEKASDYENTSYHGLYHFIRYIDRLIKYEVDIGEAETSGEQENNVRLMTIHKSKGLEFPVVFVAGMGKKFNLQDARGDMIFHPDYGVGIKYCDPEKRTKTDTFIRRALSVEAKKESLGEELRILYVAMTRAKEKLLICGIAPDKDIMTESPEGEYEKIDLSQRIDASSFWDWVLPALKGYNGKYPLQYIGPTEEAEDDAVHIVRTAQRRAELTRQLGNVDGEILSGLDERFSWEYPHRLYGLKQKVSVSELKHRAMDEAAEFAGDDDAEKRFPDPIPDPYLPRFISEQDENDGALRGTAFHRLMECMDLSSASEPYDIWVQNEIERLCNEGRILPEDAARIDVEKVSGFMKTDLSRRMSEAARHGLLVREQPFVMSVSACSIRSDADPDDNVLVQGIIDAFWEEDDGLVLLDYKTDNVESAGILLDLYQTQIALYAEALGRRFPEKSVKDALIYWFRCGEVVEVSV